MTKENVKDFPKQSSFEGTKGFWLQFEKEERVKNIADTCKVPFVFAKAKWE